VDAKDEEARCTGKLKAGHRTIAGVVSQDVHDRLLALQRKRGIPTMSRTLGVVLQEWASGVASGGLKPVAEGGEGAEGSDGDPSLKPVEPRDMTLSLWQEVRGLVTEVRQEGQHVCVVLGDRGDLLAVRLPNIAGGPRVSAGSRVAILRTDTSHGYVVRSLG